MPKIKLQNLNEKYENAGVKQKLVDLYTGQGFFVVKVSSARVQSLLVSDKEIGKISDLLQWNPDRPFFLSYLTAGERPTKIEKYLMVIGCKQVQGYWELHMKEVKDNFDVFKLLRTCKNGLTETPESI
jgi:hypothetical protein